MSTSGKKVRLQIEVSEEKHKKIGKLMEKLDISTYKDLLDNALILFETVAMRVEDGRVVIFHKEGGLPDQELLMPCFEILKK